MPARTTNDESAVVKEKILITGAAGYLGQIMVPMLLERGHSVIVFDPAADAGSGAGTFPLVTPSTAHRLRLIKGDICSPTELDAALADQSVTAVVHLAAMVGAPPCQAHPEKARRLNVLGTDTLLAAMQRAEGDWHKTTKFIFASTDSVYGTQDGVEIVDESCKPNPSSVYADTKVDGEEMTRARGGITFRQVTMFGASPVWRDHLLIHYLVHEALEHGRIQLFQSRVNRNFIHVRDNAKAFVFALEHYDRLKGQVFNLGNPDMGTTKLAVAEMIKRHLLPDLVIEVKDDAGKDLDNRNNRLSFDKLKALGFKCDYSFVDGLREVLTHYQQKNGTKH